MGLWILVANSSKAEIYSLNGKNIERVHLFDFPEGRQRSGEVLTDKPGRAFDRPTQGRSGQMVGRHAYSSETDFHTHEIQLFAHRIVDVLKKEKDLNHFDSLDIVAPPQFLGELRKLLPDSIKKSIKKELNKDIPSNLSDYERVEWLKKSLELPKPASSLR